MFLGFLYFLSLRIYFIGFGEEVNRVSSSEEVSDWGMVIESEVVFGIVFSFREEDKEGWVVFFGVFI